MAEVIFDEVGKRYDSVSVIEGLNLEIRDEEFMVLVGPSGCGKSTALRMIAGLEEISEGRISIGGRIVNDLAPKERDIAMVFQSYALYPHMTVRENLQFGLKIRKTPREEMNRLVDDAAEILGIEHLLDRKPKQLSGGQRQRVAVGRAIVRKPSVFLFDEPLSNLDAKLRVQMRGELTKLQRRLKTTTVYVTHDQIEAMTMGDRIAVMNAGRLQQVGRPLELYGRPANLFVANFIGTPPMNFLDARISSGGSSLEGKTLTLPLPARLAGIAGFEDGRNVVVGIRPESIHEPDQSRAAETAEIAGEIEIVEPVGHQVVVYFRVGEDLLTASLEARSLPRAGETIRLLVDLDAVHLFDRETEQRLG